MCKWYTRFNLSIVDLCVFYIYVCVYCFEAVKVLRKACKQLTEVRVFIFWIVLWGRSPQAQLARGLRGYRHLTRTSDTRWKRVCDITHQEEGQLQSIPTTERFKCIVEQFRQNNLIVIQLYSVYVSVPPIHIEVVTKSNIDNAKTWWRTRHRCAPTHQHTMQIMLLEF